MITMVLTKASIAWELQQASQGVEWFPFPNPQMNEHNANDGRVQSKSTSSRLAFGNRLWDPPASIPDVCRVSTFEDVIQVRRLVLCDYLVQRVEVCGVVILGRASIPDTVLVGAGFVRSPSLDCSSL